MLIWPRQTKKHGRRETRKIPATVSTSGARHSRSQTPLSSFVGRYMTGNDQNRVDKTLFLLAMRTGLIPANVSCARVWRSVNYTRRHRSPCVQYQGFPEHFWLGLRMHTLSHLCCRHSLLRGGERGVSLRGRYQRVENSSKRLVFLHSCWPERQASPPSTKYAKG